MRAAALFLLALTPLSLAGDKSATPSAQYRSLDSQFTRGMAAFQKALAAARTDAERQKVIKDKLPSLPDFHTKFLALAKTYPTSDAAVDALIWIVTHPPRTAGPGDKTRNNALALLKKYHLKDDRIGKPCTVLIYSADAEGEAFLRAVVANSPYRSVQARAHSSLALHLKYRARLIQQLKDEKDLLKQYETAWGKDLMKEFMARDPAKMLAEATKLLERVRDRYGKVPHPTHGFHADLAKVALLAIKQPVVIDKPAPEIEGKDLDGKAMKLSDFKGKVVLIDFWGTTFPACRERYAHERGLVKRLKGKPFVLLGVAHDANTAQLRKTLKDEGNTWRNWTPPDSIATRWEVVSWPTLFLIDHKGIVYDIFTGWPETKALDKAIDDLVKKAEK